MNDKEVTLAIKVNKLTGKAEIKIMNAEHLSESDAKTLLRIITDRLAQEGSLVNTGKVESHVHNDRYMNPRHRIRQN